LIARRPRAAAPLLLVLLAIAALGCSGRNLDHVGTTFPPPAPTKLVDATKVIAGLKAALGPEAPLRFKATADVRIDKVPFAVIMDGDFQGNEMDANVAFRVGGLQLSVDIIAADGKAYTRPYKGKWAKSSEKVPPAGSAPFGSMAKADFVFKGPSKTDPDLYTIVWNNPSDAARALNGTVWTKVKVKSSLMNFEVDANGKPYTASYSVKGTAKFDGKTRSVAVVGFYQFFSVREALEFKSPLKK
jgi:hypothetical protein